jgi:hypothetical protein
MVFRKIVGHRCRGSSPVERGPEKAGVGSSTLPLGTTFTLKTPFNIAIFLADYLAGAGNFCAFLAY